MLLLGLFLAKRFDLLYKNYGSVQNWDNRMADRESEEYTLHFIEQLGIKAKTLIYGKYAGIGRVVDTRHFDTYEVEGYGNFDQDNPDGYATGQCIDVLITKGVADRKRSFYRGEVVKDICSYGGDVGIIGKPQIGDIVGFRIGYYAQIWEKVDLSSPDICETEPDSELEKISQETLLSPKVNLQLYGKALKLEETNPQKALKLYSRLESENSKFHPDIFAAGIIGFVLGFVLISYGSAYIGIEKDSLALPLIWYTIGLTIVELRWLPKVSRWARGARLLLVPIMVIPIAAMKMIEVIFSFFIMILIAAVPIFAVYSIISVFHYFISGDPFVWFWSLSATATIRWSIEALFFTASFLFLAVFDVSIPKVPSIRLIFRVMRLKKREALSMLVLYASLIMFSLGWYTDNAFYTDFTTGITLSVIIGGLIGFSFASLERDHLLANLYRLAKARCLIRMNRDFETYFPLRYAYDDRKVEEPGAKHMTEEPILRRLLYATFSMTENRELKKRRTLLKWAPWGLFIGWYYLGTNLFFGIIHHRNQPVSHEKFLEHTDKARRLMKNYKYDKYREIIEGSIEKTENLWLVA